MLPTGKITEPYVQQHEDGRWMLIAPTADPKTSYCATYCETEDEAEELLSYWKEGFRVARSRFAKLPELACTEGHCEEKAKPGGCQLHNLQCGYPNCDRRPAISYVPVQPLKEQP